MQRNILFHSKILNFPINEVIMLLNDIKKTEVCDENKVLLDEQKKTVSGILDEEGFIYLSAIPSPEEQTAFFDHFYENERLHTQQIKGIYQKEKYKAKHIIMFLIAGLTLIGTGFFIAPLFLLTPIILPIASILLLSGVAIIALTKIYLNMRLNSLETCKLKAEAFLDKVVASKVSNDNEVGINDDVHGEIQELKETIQQATRTLSEQADRFAENTQKFFSTHPKAPDEGSGTFLEKEQVLNPSNP